jgi:hypothetical protein
MLEILAFLAIVGVVVIFTHHRRSSDPGAKHRQAPVASPQNQLSVDGGDRSGDKEEDDDLFRFAGLFDFGCLTKTSPNGQYVVGSADHHLVNGREEIGACALADTRSKKVLWKKSIARANNPHVTNGGVVLVEDWQDSSLSGALLCLERNGQVRWCKQFHANIIKSGLFRAGSRAFVSLARSDHDGHSNMTFVFSMATGDFLWDRCGWSDLVVFEDALCVSVKGPSNKIHRFPFDDEGKLPPEYDCAARQAEEADPSGALSLIQAAMKQKPPNLSEAKRLLEKVNPRKLDQSQKAKVQRYRGEIAAAEDRPGQAVKHWARALDLDPKVGIKRRYDVLKRKLASSKQP